MLSRISKVKDVSLKTLSFSSSLRIGDTRYADCTSYIFALQRAKANFSTKEADNIDYKVFHYPTVFPALNEPVYMTTRNEKPFIKTGSVRIIGASIASIISIGSVSHIEMLSRIKHVRQLPAPPPDQSQEPLTTVLSTNDSPPVAE